MISEIPNQAFMKVSLGFFSLYIELLFIIVLCFARTVKNA